MEDIEARNRDLDPKLIEKLGTLHNLSRTSDIRSAWRLGGNFHLVVLGSEGASPIASQYFLKYLPNDQDGEIAKSKFQSQSWLFNHGLTSVPKPVLYDLCTDPVRRGSSFLLMEFINFRAESVLDDNPDLVAQELDQFHHPPDSNLGENFQVHTTEFGGQITSTPNYTVFMQSLLGSLIEKAWGEKNRDIQERFRTEVIPRIIDTLRYRGSITPCLIHANLTQSNIQRSEQDQVYLLNATPMIAPAEFELGILSSEFNDLHGSELEGHLLRRIGTLPDGWEARRTLYMIYDYLVTAIRQRRNERGSDALQRSLEVVTELVDEG